MNKNKFITITQICEVFSTPRAAMTTWLVEIGLINIDQKPARKALKMGICKLLGQHDKPIILWNREETIAALRTAGHVPLHEQQVRLALADLIENAHPVLGWANIQELVIAVKAKEHGVEVRTI